MTKEKDKGEKEGGKPFMTMASSLVKLREKEKKSEREFLSKRTSTQDEKEINKLNYQRGLNKKEISKERVGVVLKGVGQKAEQISNKTEKVIMSLGKLGKPKAKLPSYSPKKFLRSMTNEHNALVRQVPEREQFEEPRSLFFKEEFEKAKKEGRNWLIR